MAYPFPFLTQKYSIFHERVFSFRFPNDKFTDHLFKCLTLLPFCPHMETPYSKENVGLVFIHPDLAVFLSAHNLVYVNVYLESYSGLFFYPPSWLSNKPRITNIHLHTDINTRCRWVCRVVLRRWRARQRERRKN